MRLLTPHDLGLVTLALAFAALALQGCASIPEGRSAIDAVEIHGTHEVSAGEVTDRLATTASPEFLGLIRGFVYDYSIYDESVLQRDLARVERYYRGRGFLEAHARAARVSYVGRNHVRVDITVEEGPPTNNREVGFEGVQDLPPADLKAVRDAARVALPLGDRFDEDTFKKAEDAVRRALTDRGYAYAAVKGSAKIDLGQHLIDYTFSVRPGIQAVFGSLTFVGLDPDAEGPRPPPFGEAPLRRAVNIKPGAKYSEAEIDSATQSLLDLQVLSAVRLEPDLSNPESRVVPIIARVEPEALRRLRLGGGFEFDARETEIHGLVGWEDRNFLGDLRKFSVELRPGVVAYPMRLNNLAVQQLLPEARLRLRLEQPGFIEARTRGFIQPEINVFPLLVDPNPPPDIPVPGYLEPKASVGVVRRFGKHVTVTLAYNGQVEHPFHYAGTPPLDPNLQTVVLVYPQLTTRIDFRDNAVHTHKGVLFQNDFQVAGLPGTDFPSDIRVEPQVVGYVPLAHGVTLALRGRVGFIFAANYGNAYRKDLQYVANQGPVNATLANCQMPGHQNDPVCATLPSTLPYCEANPDLPACRQLLQSLNTDIQTIYFRGFFSGGPNSNRGYVLRDASPWGIVPFLTQATAQAQALNCAPKQGGGFDVNSCTIPIGGFSLWEASAEVRFEITGPFGATVFCDSGNVSPDVFTLDFTAPRVSCGAGARYDTPVGPVRLDFGYRIQPLQVIGQPNETAAVNANPTFGHQPTLFGWLPAAINFGIGEVF